MSAKVIVVASTKGGSGKSSIAIALAVCASEREKVVLIDADPQQSIGLWWERRGKPENPSLITVEDERQLARAIARERVGKNAWAFIDSPPGLLERVESAVELADFVLIPVRPSMFDAEAVAPVVELCTTHSRPFAFIVTHADKRWKMLPGFVEALGEYGDDAVLDQHVSYSDAYASAVTSGKTGPEMRGKAGSDAKEEIAALWQEVKRRVTGKRGRS